MFAQKKSKLNVLYTCSLDNFIYCAMENDYFETDYVQLKLCDGIIYITYKKGVTINLSVAKEIVKTRIEFTSNLVFPMLLFDEGVKSIDKEARDFFSSKEGIAKLSACAMVLKSVYSTFLGNFLIKITNPPIPVKIFTEEKKAKEWIAQYVKGSG